MGEFKYTCEYPKNKAFDKQQNFQGEKEGLGMGGVKQFKSITYPLPLMLGAVPKWLRS